MLDKLPLTVDAERLSQNGADFKGQYALAAMPRLRELVENDQGCCDVDLQLAAAGRARLMLTGTVSAQLNLVCERCLEPFVLPVAAEVAVELVREESEQHREHDVFELDEEGCLPLLTLVEDEILLQLPSMPKHERVAECNQDMIQRATEHVPVEDAQQKGNPFAVLESLKK